MSGLFCGTTSAAELPDLGLDVPCCWGTVIYDDPKRCTCWVEQYDQVQLPRVDPLPLPQQRTTCCADCASKPGSPESQGEPGYAHNDEDGMVDLVVSGQRFWCHQGMVRVVRLVHPSGAMIDAHPAAYEPAFHGPIPLKADGTPADICAGWAARRAAYLKAVAEFGIESDESSAIAEGR